MRPVRAIQSEDWTEIVLRSYHRCQGSPKVKPAYAKEETRPHPTLVHGLYWRALLAVCERRRANEVGSSP